MRLAVVSGLALWTGATLLLSQARWFARAPLAERLRPFSPGGLGRGRPGGLLSVESFREVIGPLAERIGERLARAAGVTEALAVRLARVHSPLDVAAFRLRQLGWALGGLAAAVLAAAAARPPPALALVLLVSGPLLGFLAVEQHLAAASARRQRRVFLELPVVSEQLAMLLSAGFSLGASLNRLAVRGRGACAEDLRQVTARVRQGLPEAEALAEWAAVAAVPALDRLVAVLALDREAADLGRLITDEARAVRRDLHRQVIETLDRRGQQVWVPVTVATLVPGVVFLSIPFIEALRLFSGS